MAHFHISIRKNPITALRREAFFDSPDPPTDRHNTTKPLYCRPKSASGPSSGPFSSIDKAAEGSGSLWGLRNALSGMQKNVSGMQNVVSGTQNGCLARKMSVRAVLGSLQLYCQGCRRSRFALGSPKCFVGQAKCCIWQAK